MILDFVHEHLLYAVALACLFLLCCFCLLFRSLRSQKKGIERIASGVDFLTEKAQPERVPDVDLSFSFENDPTMVAIKSAESDMTVWDYDTGGALYKESSEGGEGTTQTGTNLGEQFLNDLHSKDLRIHLLIFI